MDTLIKNGTIVVPEGRYQGDIAISGGKIAAIYEPGKAPASGDAEIIDAKGLAVFPGVIDMHSHHRQGSKPGFEYKDTIYTSTQQCAAGGVTTSVAMPNVTPPPNTMQLLQDQFAIYETDAIVDWNFNPAPTIIEEVPPGEYASTTLSSGEHVRVELPAGAIAGQELLFVLPPTTAEGCEPRLPKPAPLAGAAAGPHPAPWVPPDLARMHLLRIHA